MKYIKIDQDGAIIEGEASTYRQALDQVGPEGWNMVQLTRNLVAFVNDCGLIMPERYSRNPIGGLTIIALGATLIPYAGPIVLTGWDHGATYRDEPEVISLTPLQVATINAVHDMVAGVVSDGCSSPGSWISDADRDAIIDMAHHITHGNIPPVTSGPVR